MALLTVQEVADRLQVNQQTVRNWIDRGELRGLRVGARRVRIDEADLEEFVGREVEPRPITTAPEPLIDPKVVLALREFSEAAARLADALQRSGRS